MSSLEVVFRLGLAHPLLFMDALNARAKAHFPDTGNTVSVEIQFGSWPDKATDRGVFDTLLVHVERECRPEDRDNACGYAKLIEWGVVGDGATALGRFLEHIRDEDFLLNGTVAGYPAVISESPQANPIVQSAKAEIIFDGEPLTTMSLSGVPSIQIAGGTWDRVCERLERGEEVPAYRGFLLDAYYFATSGDPIRAVIMGCAAWETALRQFLSSIGKRNLERRNLPSLRRLAEQAKGVALFDSGYDPVAALARLRNKLLHAGEKGHLTKEDIVGMLLATDAAIKWLFDSKAGVQQTPPNASP
jgi:hypothetical protein